MSKPPSHQQTWNELGAWWDEQTGDEGDDFHRRLIHPNILKLLDKVRRGPLLDAGCGNGALSRKLASAGFDVTAIDVSASLLGGAHKRTDPTKYPTLHYEKIDLTSESELSRLPSNHFGAAVCSMVLHDIPDIKPLLRALRRCLTADGIFLFSVPHPCFNSPYVTFDEGALRITNYVQPLHVHMHSKPGQPILQDTFHLPLSALFSELFESGFAIDGFVEPSFSESDALGTGLWARYPHIAPALIVRCRL